MCSNVNKQFWGSQDEYRGIYHRIPPQNIEEYRQKWPREDSWTFGKISFFSIFFNFLCPFLTMQTLWRTMGNKNQQKFTKMNNIGQVTFSTRTPSNLHFLPRSWLIHLTEHFQRLFQSHFKLELSSSEDSRNSSNLSLKLCSLIFAWNLSFCTIFSILKIVKSHFHCQIQNLHEILKILSYNMPYLWACFFFKQKLGCCNVLPKTHTCLPLYPSLARGPS